MKMKKTAALFLTAAMAVASTVPALAADSPKTVSDDTLSAQEDTTDVAMQAQLTKDTSDTPATVYGATVTWTAGTLKGNLSKSSYKWDAENTKYVLTYNAVTGMTNGSDADVSITVTNTSNASIYYSISETDDSDFTLTHTNGDGVASTEITAADLVDSNGDTATTARANMTAGETDETKLTGKGVDSAEYTDTVSLVNTSLKAPTTTDAAIYTVTISKDAISE